MAFKKLRRFFSLKKSDKTVKKRPQIVHNVPTTRLQPISESGLLADDSGEVTANQLLRSSSARYAVVNECDYTSLPPLPHPINQVLQTPSSSTISLASASTSINSTTRGTYTVKVHRRTHHALTEFPNANRDVGDDPTHRNNSQLLGLRSDPSVASLLDLYDEHGRVSARAFSNSPPSAKGKEGRAQVQRNGSTLRQLLGNPSSSVNSRNAALEGDISWAERFLGETESLASSTSSLGLTTPDTDSHFPETPLHANADNSFVTEHDFSSEDPAISSLEVELSDITETPPRPSRNSPYADQDPKTPQRASQVFGFLTDKRRSRAVEDDERSLPELPSTFSSPSDEASPPVRSRSRSHFSSDSSADSIEPAAPVPVTPIETHFHPVDLHRDITARANDVQVIMENGPTKVIVTAPTPSYHDNIVPMRIPRGPRSHHRQRAGSGRERQADSFTAVPSRRHVSRRTSASTSIPVSLAERVEPPQVKTSTKGKRRSILAVFEKENHLSAKQELPRTPIRTGSISRPFQRGATHRAPASPASSLELSAAGQQLMVDLRQQRMHAREQDRRRVYV
ncbi:hypothetical protein DFH09DRAFT_974775 [Mycena vulgaris]|nr:hypothetical protein DFH09DRAFT_974775 [Mycena vulgaris]